MQTLFILLEFIRKVPKIGDSSQKDSVISSLYSCNESDKLNKRVFLVINTPKKYYTGHEFNLRREIMRAEKNKKKKRVKKIVLLIVIFSLLGIGAYLTYAFMSANHFFNSIQGEPIPSNEENDIVVLENKEPFSILLLGVDERPGDIGRADTIMVATVNPTSEDIKLVSISRDTLIELPDTGEADKINATYAYGGIPYVIETVENYLDIPIQYYAQINFQGMVDLVDAVGGIEVISPLDFTVQDSTENADTIHIEKGKQHLNGEEALGYARMRKQDPRGDWGRQERQRQVIEAIVDETVSISSLANFNTIFNAIAPNLKTNLSGRDIWILGTNYASAARNIESLTLDGEADTIYFPSYGQDVYVWVPYEDTIEEIQQVLQEHLEIDSMNANVPSEESTISETESEAE